MSDSLKPHVSINYSILKHPFQWFIIKKLEKSLYKRINYQNDLRPRSFYWSTEWANKRYLNSIRNNAIFRLLLVKHQRGVNKSYYFLFSIFTTNAFLCLFANMKSILKDGLREFRFWLTKWNFKIIKIKYFDFHVG